MSGQPVLLNDVYSRTVQTHSNTTINATSWGTSTDWIDVGEFAWVSLTMMNDATTGSSGNILWSHDGTTQHGEDSAVIPTGTAARKGGYTKIKARYMKVTINNSDAAAHNISAWAYLSVN